MVLGEARGGDSRRLQLWLKSHAAEHSLSSNTSHLGSKVSNTNAAAADQPDFLESWSQLLAPARNRLLEQAQRLRSAADSTRLEGRKRGTTDNDNNAEKTANVAATPALAEGVATDRRQRGRTELPRGLNYSRLRGMLASVGAHVLLVLLLGWITVRLPTPPASLALDASPTELTSQSLDIVQPLEVSQPPSQDETRDMEKSYDVSESFENIASHVSSAIGQISAPSSSSMLSGPGMSVGGSTAQQLMQTNAMFFGAVASGNCFCYVIDGSGSMRHGPWEAAKLELLKSLATLKEKQRFYIIFFNRELNAIPLPGERTPAPTALYATEENLLHTRRWLDSLRIGVGGPPNDALAMAIDKEPDAIYLLTDGVTNVDVPKFLRDKNRVTDVIAGEQVRVPIHTIAFYSLDGQDLLTQIAKENRGEFIYVPDPRRPRTP